MSTRQVDEYLKRLKRLLKFQEQKLEEKEPEKSHYLIAETLALRWIIEYTEDTIIEAADHQSKWKEKRVR